MLKIEKPGYHKAEVVEPVILEEEEYRCKPEEWNVIKELCGFQFEDRVSRIVLNISSVEYYVEQ